MSGLAARIGDRLNPILVKEVRQALRGRLFRWTFGFTLVAALLVAFLVLMYSPGTTDKSVGPTLAVSMYTCLLASAVAFVPFAAFVSMGAEWDENTYDLLVLSNLTPRRIVYGKLGAALVQAVVSFSAFTPFFVFAFLMRGVNLPSLLLLLGGVLLFSPCVSLVAIGLSSSTTNRFLRIVIMVLLSAGLVLLTVLGANFAGFAVFGRFFRWTVADLATAIAGILSIALVVAAWFGEHACVRLAHPEENGSTGPRVAVFASLLCALVWAGVAVHSFAHADPLSAISIAVIFTFVLPASFFMSEPERLGRRVALHVPRNRTLALLAAPFLPGGGRGVLYWLLLHVVLAIGMVALHACFLGAPWTSSALDEWWKRGLPSVLLATTYATSYLALPTRLFASATKTARARTLTRLSVYCLALLSILLPTVFLFLVDGGRTSFYKHWLNVFWAIDRVWSGAWVGAVVVGLVVWLFVVLLNLSRMTDGVREVLQWSAARRRREAHANPVAEGSVPAESTADATTPS